MMYSRKIPSVIARLTLLSALVFSATTHAQPFPGGRTIDKKLYHLGDDVVELWPEVSPKPEGDHLEVTFDAKANDKEYTLTLTYWDLNYPAQVKLNDKLIDTLPVSQPKRHTWISIPAGTLKNGKNTIFIKPKKGDDCAIGNLVLHDQSFRELKRLKPVTLSVLDSKSKTLIPARITITDSKGNLSEIFYAPTNGTAVRDGMIYVSPRETTVELVEGDYTIYATRGMEWSRDVQRVSLRSATNLQLKIRREVDTTGFVACDTHLHTLTFSGHGDASVEERMVTLAGEGVELAVATDHHHHTDYRPFQEKLELNEYFTPVTGNEVSTKVGHINTFPMNPNGPVPDKNETNWVKLVQDMRNRGGKVTILNHPRWPRQDVFVTNGLNKVTGERANGVAVPFDGMELINSSTVHPDKMRLLQDWFALMNYGERIRAVGASDSHTVASIVGQGRTYIRSSTDVPSEIDVEEACNTILKGDISVSYGMFADVVLNGRFRMGDTVSVREGSKLRVALRAAAPSWVRPEKAIVFLNGYPVAEKPLSAKEGKAFDETLTFTIPVPKHDAHLVCVVFGDGVKDPSWRTREPYTFATTNPIFLDVDRDGKYRNPRETAKNLLSQAGSDLESQWAIITSADDDAIATQMLSLVYGSADKSKQAQLTARLEGSNRTAFSAFLAELPK